MRSLIIGAHMDDESISCGGLIARRVASGGEVSVLIICGRKYGDMDEDAQRRSDDAEFADFRGACAVLGVSRRVCLRFTEGEPHSTGFYRMLGPIEKELAEFEPDEVLIHSAEDLNQDHVFLHHVCQIALRPINVGGVKRVLEFAALDGRLRPSTFYVTLTRSELDLKLRAINCYRRERRSIPSPRAPENVEAQARVWGAAAGVEFAEAYSLYLGRD